MTLRQFVQTSGAAPMERLLKFETDQLEAAAAVVDFQPPFQLPVYADWPEDMWRQFYKTWDLIARLLGR